LDRRGIAQRMQELDLGIGQLHEYHGDAVRGLGDGGRHAGPEGAAIGGRGGCKIRHRDGNVVQSSDHPSSRVAQCCSAKGAAQGPLRYLRWMYFSCFASLSSLTPVTSIW